MKESESKSHQIGVLPNRCLQKSQESTLRENCPYTEFFLVRIFLYSD